MTPVLIAQIAGNCPFGKVVFKISQGSMPPDPPTILMPSVLMHTFGMLYYPPAVAQYGTCLHYMHYMQYPSTSFPEKPF